MLGERTYYLPSEVAELLKKAGKSKSTFYKLVREGKIIKTSVDLRTVYPKEQVDAFLSVPSRTISKKRPKNKKRSVVATVPAMSNIEVARSDDFLPLYLLESGQLDYMRAIVPPILHSWSEANNLIYWFEYDHGNRAEVLAMLGILPLSEETIQRLLSGSIAFSQIPPDAIQAYQPGEQYDCVIVSAATKAGQRDAILLLIQRAFADWSRRSILINSIYALNVTEQEDSPLASIIAHCAFFPLDEEGTQWRLRPFYRKIQPASFVLEYRSSALNEKRKVENMLLMQKDTKTAIAALHQFFEKEKREVGTADHSLVETVLNHFVCQDDGRILRTDLPAQKQRHVFVRPIASDGDLRAAMLVNASLFGASTRFTLDELVAHRRAWIEKNPDIYRVLEIDGNIVGYVFILPPTERVLDGLLRESIFPGQIPLDELYTYQPGETYNLFLHTIGIHKSIQDVTKRLAGFYLLAGTYKLLVDLAKRGVKVRALYARSHEVDGANIAAGLDMDEIFIPGVDDALLLKLDFSDETKTSLREYRRALDAYISNAAK